MGFACIFLKRFHFSRTSGTCFKLGHILSVNCSCNVALSAFGSGSLLCKPNRTGPRQACVGGCNAKVQSNWCSEFQFCGSFATSRCFQVVQSTRLKIHFVQLRFVFAQIVKVLHFQSLTGDSTLWNKNRFHVLDALLVFLEWHDIRITYRDLLRLEIQKAHKVALLLPFF